jgi:hypothetical protein
MGYQRDFKVTGLNLKGKAKTPVVSLESAEGEKLTIILENPMHLASFEIGEEFSMRLSKDNQTRLFPTFEKGLEAT